MISLCLTFFFNVEGIQVVALPLLVGASLTIKRIQKRSFCKRLHGNFCSCLQGKGHYLYPFYVFVWQRVTILCFLPEGQKACKRFFSLIMVTDAPTKKGRATTCISFTLKKKVRQRLTIKRFFFALAYASFILHTW